MDPLSNYGGAYYLCLAFNEYAIQYVWLKFNLSQVPDGAVVDYAALKIFPTVVTVTHEISAYYCSNNSWAEYTINFLNQPEFDSVALDTTLVGVPNKWYSWNVTSAVKKSLDGVFNGSDIVTIVLKQNNWHTSLRQLKIVSRDYALRSNLYVHWTDIVPEFPTPTQFLAVFLILTLIMVMVGSKMIDHSDKHAKENSMHAWGSHPPHYLKLPECVCFLAIFAK